MCIWFVINNFACQLRVIISTADNGYLKQNHQTGEFVHLFCHFVWSATVYFSNGKYACNSKSELLTANHNTHQIFDFEET